MKHNVVMFLNLHVDWDITFPLGLKFSPFLYMYTMFFCINVMSCIFVANIEFKMI